MSHPVVAALEIVPWDAKKERTVDMLVSDIAEGIMVLATRDGLPVTLEMALDRARNIVTGLMGSFKWELLS